MKKSFTLIELIIAIVIFWVWIITILVSLSNNISISQFAKNKTFATFLAKEGIEIVFNIRDTNTDKWIAWNCNKLKSDYSCENKFKIWDYYQVSLNMTGFTKINATISWFENNIIYFHSWYIYNTNNLPILSGFWYDYNDNWQKTFFSRYIYFDWIKIWEPWTNLDQNDILKIESHVIYNRWTQKDKVVLESFISQH